MSQKFGKNAMTCDTTQRIRKTCKKYRAVAESGFNAVNFDHISQAESLIKGKNC